jgi:Protein of unknown function (DUF3891)
MGSCSHVDATPRRPAVLVTRRRGRLVLMRQTDHAALAGSLAQQWGNDQFGVPAPREALICAAIHHDDGWLEMDGRPIYNPEAQRPAHFTEVALAESVGPYGRGVESVYARDPHAGALVSMHFSGFYTGRWGASGGGPPQNPIAQEVVATQEARWISALREVWGYRGLRSEFDAGTWHAYEVLQAVDLVSLALGLMDLEHPATADPVDAGSHLAAIDQPPGPRLVGSVPVRSGGPYTRIAVACLRPGQVKLDPYPLREPAVEVVLPQYTLEDRAYTTAGQAAEALAASRPRELRLTITAGD